MAAQESPAVPSLAWAEFLAQFRWEQGEHVSFVGPTKSGKTTLALALLPLRRNVAVLGTKPRDATLAQLANGGGYRRMPDWTPRPHERRVLLWPRLTRAMDWRSARPIYEHALASIYEEGGWCVYVDEARVICDERRPFLGLAPYLRLLWTQGRSLGLSIVAGTQRPAWVPPEMFDQAEHVFFFQDADSDNLRKLGGLGGLDARTIREAVPNLNRHELLYVNTRDRQLIRTKVAR